MMMITIMMFLKKHLFQKLIFSTSSIVQKKTEMCLKYCRKNNIRILHFSDKDYPCELLKLKDFPPLLFVKGNLKGLQKCAAVVGTRNPSILAKDKVDHLVKTFSDHDYGIVSGLALGVDAMAHKAAINNKSFTAAILPVSFDKLFPKENMELAKCIFDTGGVLITEQAPNYIPVANPFVMRNRSIASLSDYLIPVEMGIDSGTRHAVNYAVKYGKKLILCKPNYYELDYYILYYEGIIVVIKKYRGKQNVSVSSDLKQVSNCFDNDSRQQLQLM
jgi:DNA processing protein